MDDTSEANKALVRRFLDALHSGDVATAAACFDAERYYSHAYGGDLATTWEHMKARRRRAALTEYVSESIALVADGDRVAHHSHVRATHNGPVLGAAASGRTVEFDMLEIWRIEDDKIVEHWGGLEEAERLRRELTGEAEEGT